ncbi:hypothetical protein [Streptomyces zhihengii]|uniref:Uncharacterized protein n=1 Tax=Streptomyces zhihengii TaxID=1818004 RepID=A0ABS2V3F1_9ACTN|nr:hypothetical protein [Streptomyces zhihengii]MBM9623987.1 hypothetical protein [Streptomyces zhihengii]
MNTGGVLAANRQGTTGTAISTAGIAAGSVLVLGEAGLAGGRTVTRRRQGAHRI